MNAIATRTVSTSRYGVTEKKKAEIDQLTSAVTNAQHRVNQCQAILNAVTEKSQKFQGFLNTATTNQAQALSNKVAMENVIQNAQTLFNNSSAAFNQMSVADKTSKKLAEELAQLINKLIYTGEVIDKLSNYVIRQKALNPLISDELIGLIGTAGKDTNNAVALTLVALKSTFTTQSNNIESEAALALEYNDSQKLYNSLIGLEKNGKINPVCLSNLIADAYKRATDQYNLATTANNDTTKELFSAADDLNKAQIKLKSLQAGLAAANAAALAS